MSVLSMAGTTFGKKPDSDIARNLIALADCEGSRPPAPPIVKRMNQLGAWGIGLLSLTFALGLFASHFVPSHKTVEVTEGLVLVVGLFYFVFAVGVGRFGWDKNSPRAKIGMARSRILAKAYIRGPLLAVIFAAFAWVSFASVFPWALNAVIGNRGTMTVTVDGWSPASNGKYPSCAQPTLQGIPIGMMGGRALCFSDYSQVDFPRGTHLVLIGRTSVLGIAPDHYRFPSVGEDDFRSITKRGGIEK